MVDTRKIHFICVTAVYFADTDRVIIRYTAHVSRLRIASVMPNKSLLPLPPFQPMNTMSMAPAMPTTTPTMPRLVILSPMKSAAHTIVPTGVRVAIRLKYTGLVKLSAQAVKVWEMTNPNKPPAMITKRSLRSIGSLGRNNEITQKTAAAPMQRVAI